MAPQSAAERDPGWRRRQVLRARIAIATAVVAVPLIGLAIGAIAAWQASDRVLVPDPSDWPQDIDVLRVGAGRIVLSRRDGSERPGVFGLNWQAGHAIVGSIIAEDGDSVTRRLRDVRGYLTPGLRVGTDSYVYSGEPRQAIGLPSRDVDIPSELGPLPSWWIPGRGRVWAIVVHGINSNPQAGLRIAPVLHRLGLDQLLITYRDDRGAPSSPDGYHHMGLTEWRDVAAAARFALAHGARRLLLVGYSMGGALVTQFMERSPLARRVAALVLDAPVLDWRATIEYGTTQTGLPAFLANPVEWAVSARIDADWDALDVLDHTSDLHLPILLFHGADDETVPISTSEALASALPRFVRFYRVPGAGHTEEWNVAPRLYDRRLSQFLADNVPEKTRARLSSGSK